MTTVFPLYICICPVPVSLLALTPAPLFAHKVKGEMYSDKCKHTES
jgi:hypothetical protein